MSYWLIDGKTETFLVYNVSGFYTNTAHSCSLLLITTLYFIIKL